MELVEIGDYKVGDNLIIDFGENNPNNKQVQVRAIVDMEVVVMIDQDENYLMETIKYMNLLCKFGNIIRVTKKGERKFEDLVHDPRI